MLPIFTLILPGKLNCFPLMISLYFVKAYWNIPLAYRHSAWLSATAKDNYTLIKSVVFEVYLCLRKFFSLFVTSLAFSKASKFCPEIFKLTHFSSSKLISFSNFLKFYSGLLVFLAVKAVLYLVPSSSLALSCSLLENPMPWFDCGLPDAPPAAEPALPAREGVGLYELGGGLIYLFWVLLRLLWSHIVRNLGLLPVVLTQTYLSNLNKSKNQKLTLKYSNH